MLKGDIDYVADTPYHYFFAITRCHAIFSFIYVDALIFHDYYAIAYVGLRYLPYYATILSLR